MIGLRVFAALSRARMVQARFRLTGVEMPAAAMLRREKLVSNETPSQQSQVVLIWSLAEREALQRV